MADFNQVILMGRLTRDPELQYTASSHALCNFGMATNRHWTDSSGEKQEEACFVDCRAFGRQAEIINEYVSKGALLFVEGRLSFYAWEDDDGQRRSKLSVVVEKVQLMPKSNGQGQDDDVQRGAASPQPSQAPPPEGQPALDGEPADDDIPF